MLNLFTWLKRRVSQSIIEGVEDALEALDAGHGPGATTVPLCLPDALRTRLLTLPALASKAEPDTTGDEPVTSGDMPVTNGRRKRS